MRLALAGQPIEIFGEGEEQRDHVWIEDVAEVATRTLLHESSGVLNVASGEVISFGKLANIVGTLFPGVSVVRRPRIGLMPHNGYRSFNTRALRSAFPDLTQTSVLETLPRLRDSFEAGWQ
jgi:nucleoside-diphosphate-sugar epimerase